MIFHRITQYQTKHYWSLTSWIFLVLIFLELEDFTILKKSQIKHNYIPLPPNCKEISISKTTFYKRIIKITLQLWTSKVVFNFKNSFLYKLYLACKWILLLENNKHTKWNGSIIRLKHSRNILLVCRFWESISLESCLCTETTKLYGHF